MSNPAAQPPAVTVSVPAGFVVSGLPVAPRCYYGTNYPYPGYAPNSTYPPIPGTTGYYPNSGNTHIVVQVGLVNNLALGPNSSAGNNTAGALGRLTTNLQPPDALKEVLDRLEAGRKADHEIIMKLIKDLAEARDKQSPVVPATGKPMPSPAAGPAQKTAQPKTPMKNEPTPKAPAPKKAGPPE
jgi:hypothetical protein